MYVVPFGSVLEVKNHMRIQKTGEAVHFRRLVGLQ